MGLLGNSYDPYGGMTSLLGIDQKAMRNQALWNGLAAAGFSLMGNKNLGAAGGAFLAGTNQARDDYYKTALDAYRLKKADEAEQYQRERDAVADQRWQQNFDLQKDAYDRDAWRFGQEQDAAELAESQRLGQQSSVNKFAGRVEDWTQQGGDLFDTGMQTWLRGQGIEGVDPSAPRVTQQDYQRYNRMQPYMAAQDYGGAFQQMTAEAAAPNLEFGAPGSGIFRDGQYIGTVPKEPEPPKRVTVRRGNQEVTQEWNPVTQRYEDVAAGDAFKTTPDVVNNIDMKGEGKFAEEAAKGQAGRFQRIVDEGDKAVEMIGNIGVLRDLGTQINTGRGAEILAALGPWAEYAGISIDGLGEAQAYQAIVSRIAPSLRTPGVGSSSDFDARQFLLSLPQLGTTPEGNAIIENTLEAVAQWKIEAARISQMALSRQITPEQADAMIRQLGDPWSMWREANKKTAKPKPENAPRVRRYNPETGRIE